MKNTDKIYFEVETEKEKIDELIDSLTILNNKIEYLKHLGISRRNINKICKDLVKITVKNNDTYIPYSQTL